MFLNRSSSEREKDLEAQVITLKLKLRSKELECELLAEVNENLRQWLLANTAAAVQVGKSLGIPEEKK